MPSSDEIATVHSKLQMLLHLETELTNDVEAIIETLLPDGSGAYTWVMPTAPDGGPSYLAPHDISLRVENQREGIRKGYQELHGIYSMRDVERIKELSGSFYTFIDTISHLHMQESGDLLKVPGVALFPTEPDLPGIRGEIMWGRNELDYFEDPPSPLPLRQGENLASHNSLLSALEAGDVSSVEKLLAENSLLSVRDQVNDEVGVTNRKGRAAVVDYFEALLQRYQINKLHVVQRVSEDWYVFAELRWEVTARQGPKVGQTGHFRTAEFLTTTANHQFRAFMGHGTEFVAS